MLKTGADQQAIGRGARLRAAFMLFVTVAVNYLDRSNLSVAATALDADLRLGPVRLGFLFSAFAWSYALFQIPGGWIADRIKPGTLFCVMCIAWSAATITQGLARSFLILFGARLLLGLFEAPTYPLCNVMVTKLFPESLRARVIGSYTAAQYVGLGFLTPILAYTQRALGWRAIFIGTGILGLGCAILWRVTYPRIGGASEFQRPAGTWPARRELLALLSNRNLWGIYLGQFCLNAVPWFFLTWFPTYLVRERHLEILDAGYFAAFPFLAAFAGVIASGIISDLLARRGCSPSFARKAPIIGGLLLSTSVLAANFTNSPAWILCFMTLAFFGNGFASITWVLVSLMAPARLLGITGGIFNFFGNLAGIIVPILIGFILRGGGFAPALTLVGALTMGGVACYAFLVGRVERMDDPGPDRAHRPDADKPCPAQSSSG